MLKVHYFDDVWNRNITADDCGLSRIVMTAKTFLQMMNYTLKELQEQSKLIEILSMHIVQHGFTLKEDYI